MLKLRITHPEYIFLVSYKLVVLELLTIVMYEVNLAAECRKYVVMYMQIICTMLI